MTERLAEIGARIDGMRQLGAVVNAMRGIAAARAQRSRTESGAVEAFSALVADAIGQVLALRRNDEAYARGSGTARQALVAFCAEQGFAGAFSEHVLDIVRTDFPAAELYLVGTRGLALATEQGLAATLHAAMPARSVDISRLADHIAEALYEDMATGEVDRIDVVFNRWEPGHGVCVDRRRLFPLDPACFRRPGEAGTPLLQLTPEALLVELTGSYVHAQLCDAALHAFVAENEARMAAMAAAHGEVDRHLAELQALQRVVRQEEITAEIIELVGGRFSDRGKSR